MTIITGGVVSVEDGRKAAEEYAPPRKVRVELRFDNPPENSGEDADKLIKAVGLLASSNVAALLGQKATAVPYTPGPRQAEPGPSLTGAKAKTPEEIATADALKAASAAKVHPDKPPTGKKVAKAPVAEPDPVLDGTPAPAAVSDDISDLTGEPAKEITDADLNSATGKKNAALGAAAQKAGVQYSPAKIRALVEGFGPEGKKITLKEIPQGKRQEYLDKLAELA